MAANLSTLLPGYAVERELGRGAMGIVHLARHEKLGRRVAVKELQGALAADPAIRSRFLVEAEAMASFDHPHIVPVFDFVERDERCALVMEQLPGGTVWDRFVSAGITMPQAVAITLATCSAMHHAHGRGVLHRDIKPENLMFDGSGGMKVTDFGIARMVNGTSTKATLAGSVLGTPAYMAPEQAEGKPVDESADVYASATMLFELLSGRLPFDATDSLTAMLTQRIMHDPMQLLQIAPHVPAAIAATTMRGLAKAPTSRIATAEQFGVELATAAASAWGPTWLDSVDIDVLGSPPIERAARSGAARPDSSGTIDPRATVMPNTQLAGEPAASAQPTMMPATDSASAGTPTDQPDSASAPASSSDSTPDEAPALLSADVAHVEVVRPKTSDRDVGRARADQIDELIDISEVLRPPSRPIAQFAIAAALMVAGLAWAIIGGPPSSDADTASTATINEMPVSDQPIEVDLNLDITVAGLDLATPATLTIEQFGIPLGSIAAPVSAQGEARFEPGFIGRITSGAVTARIEGADGEAIDDVDITATNTWFLTAAGIVSVLVLLFSIASIESNLRSLRRGRNRFTSFIGLLVSGGLLGASAAAATTIILATARSTVALAGPAALCAAGAVALGVAIHANRTRRRAAKQIVRREAIRALASR